MARIGAVLALLLLTARLAGAPGNDEALARVVLTGESARTARRIAQADELAKTGKTAEAVDAYLQILAEAGDDLVPVDPRRAILARHICYQRIAKIPEALQLYRGRADIQAKKWLDEGRSQRNTVLLRRIVDEAFCSRHTAPALDLLGDLAFERGDFDEAQRWWSVIFPPASAAGASKSGDSLCIPDPSAEMIARARAKQIVSLCFQGELDLAAEEWKAFAMLHGNDRGHLCGADGKYVDILQMLLSNESHPNSASDAEAWPTFAGSPQRRGRSFEQKDILKNLPQIGGPAWTVGLETREPVVDTSEPATPPGHFNAPLRDSRALAFYPVIAADRVYVADNRYVTGYHLLTGQRVYDYDLQFYHRVDDPTPPLHLPLTTDAGYTLTIDHDRVYARLGGHLHGSSEHKEGEGGDTRSFLVCLHLQPDRNGRLERWSLASNGTAAKGPMFEGAPLVAQQRVYVAESSLAAGQVGTALGCYDADSGSLRWRQEVCSTPENREGERAGRTPLITLAGPNIVYCSHSGAIIALDSMTGRRAWAVRYSSRGRKLDTGAPTPRSLAPCLYAEGRIYVAPEDHNRILCLDPETGRQLWESPPQEAIHLIGVARSRLILTSTTPVPCIRALDATTGVSLREWLQPADGSSLATFGRGLIAGEVVLWPTRGKTGDRLFALDLESGEPEHYADLPCGNLAAANGCLVVAGTTHLTAYLPEARSKPRGALGANLQSYFRRLLASKRKEKAISFVHSEITFQEKATATAPRTDYHKFLPLVVAWQRAHTPDDPQSAERYFPCPANNKLFSLCDREVICREADTGRFLWKQECLAGPGWLGCVANFLIAASNDQISCFDANEGGVVWRAKGSKLGKFKIAGDRLYCIQDERRLLAIDVGRGELAWDAWAPAAKLDLPAPVGCYGPTYHATAGGVFIETARGRSLLVDGKTQHSETLEENDRPWRQPPIPIDANATCLFPAADEMKLVGCQSGQEIWHHASEPATSLSGAPAQILSAGHRLILLTCRNYGCFLDCLERQTGKPLWARSEFIGADNANLTDGCVDDAALYFARANVLESRALKDGVCRWRRKLPRPGSDWGVFRLDGYLFVYPVQAQRAEFRLLSWTPPFAGVWPILAPSGLSISVFLVEASTGGIVQRINLYAETSTPGQRGLPLSRPGLSLPSTERTQLQRTRSGVVVIAGDNAWGLAFKER